MLQVLHLDVSKVDQGVTHVIRVGSGRGREQFPRGPRSSDVDPSVGASRSSEVRGMRAHVWTRKTKVKPIAAAGVRTSGASSAVFL